MLVGELVDDPVVKQKEARFKIKTGRPFKRGNNVEWDFVTHDILCYKDAAFNMLKTIAKKGKWMKVSGEISIENNKPIILIRKNLGDLGLMFDVLNSDLSQSSKSLDSIPEAKESEEDPYMSSFSSGKFSSHGNQFKSNNHVDDDDIPF